MDRKIRIRRVLAPALATLAFLSLTISPVSAAGTSGGGSIASCSLGGSCVHALLKVLNRERGWHGLSALKLENVQSDGGGGCAGSLGHSVAMAQTRTIWHVNRRYPRQSFPKNICVPYHIVGENVGAFWRPNTLQDLKALNRMMMAEAHDPSTCAATVNHACNILNPKFRAVGIGIDVTGGMTWLTEDFVG